MALILSSGSIDARTSAVNPQFVGSASYASNALTASYAENAGGATFETGSLLTTASITGTTQTFTKGDGTTFTVTITDSVSASYAVTSSHVGEAYVSSSVVLNTITFNKGDGTTDSILVDTGSSLPAGVVSSSVQVSSITGSSIVNAETSSVSNANGLVFTKGDGTTILVTQDTSSFVKAVNGQNPGANGNVTVSITSVETGTSASMLDYSSSGNFNEGDVWVVSGESGSLTGSNGETYIYSSTTNELLSISPTNQAFNDQRYVLKGGDTMIGSLILDANPSNVLGATPKQYVDLAYTGSAISSAANGEQTLTFQTRGGATDSVSWVSSSYAISSSVSISSSFATTSSYVTASNVQGPYGASSVLSSSYSITASHALNSVGNVQTPVISGSLSVSMEQGSSGNFTGYTETGGNPGMWAILNDDSVLTGSLSTVNNISVGNTLTTNVVDVTGSFDVSLYILTALGRSEPTVVTIDVTPFTLSSSNAFGNDIEDYYIQISEGSSSPQFGDDGKYLFWGHGIHSTGGTLDVEGTVIGGGIDVNEYSVWYNESAGRLLAFEYSTGGSRDSIVTIEVPDFTNKTTNQNSTAVSTPSSNEKLGGKIRGYYWPNGYYQIGSPVASRYLKLTPDAGSGVLDNFGTKSNGSWMYGFNLLDDWTISTMGNQMLSPATNADGAHVFAPGVYFITTTETDFIAYGNATTSADTSLGISWASTNGVLAPSGSSIIVYFDDATDTYYLYVDGTQEINSTDIDIYMSTTTSTDPELHFGNPINSQPLNGQRWTRGWGYRINNLWIANTGTSLGTADVSELSSHADISNSTNYASIDFHSQNFDAVEKGAVSLSRGII